MPDANAIRDLWEVDLEQEDLPGALACSSGQGPNRSPTPSSPSFSAASSPSSASAHAARPMSRCGSSASTSRPNPPRRDERPSCGLTASAEPQLRRVLSARGSRPRFGRRAPMCASWGFYADSPRGGAALFMRPRRFRGSSVRPSKPVAHSPLLRRQAHDVDRPRRRLQPAEDVAGVQRPAVRLDRRDHAPLERLVEPLRRRRVGRGRVSSRAPPPRAHRFRGPSGSLPTPYPGRP